MGSHGHHGNCHLVKLLVILQMGVGPFWNVSWMLPVTTWISFCEQSMVPANKSALSCFNTNHGVIQVGTKAMSGSGKETLVTMRQLICTHDASSSMQLWQCAATLLWKCCLSKVQQRCPTCSPMHVGVGGVKRNGELLQSQKWTQSWTIPANLD